MADILQKVSRWGGVRSPDRQIVEQQRKKRNRGNRGFSIVLPDLTLVEHSSFGIIQEKLCFSN